MTDRNLVLQNFEKHLAVLKGLASSSVSAYRRHVEEFLNWRDGNALDGPATRGDIERYLEYCFLRGNGNQTRTTKLIALQSYFRFLRYTGEMNDDPSASIPRMRSTKPFMQTFTREEILRLFGTIDVTTDMGLRDACFLIFGAFAGFRVSEIVNFNIDHIQDDGKEMDLVIPKTKRGAWRSVYLWRAPSMFIRQLLIARVSAGARTGDPLLVSHSGRSSGKRLTTRSLDMLIKKLAKRAGLRKAKIKCHMLRASHACDARHVRGYDVFAIMQRMGWENLETAARYITRRERIHKEYRSWHEYWLEFGRVWTEPESAINISNAEPVTHNHAGHVSGSATNHV